mmetsp:Transcript_43851/g.121308  ORF Transcript_43851/g.121308 Transcript_43851/m.121308 type:complete len:282 (+) Transcript_43851:3450-4295(+)
MPSVMLVLLCGGSGALRISDALVKASPISLASDMKTVNEHGPLAAPTSSEKQVRANSVLRPMLPLLSSTKWKRVGVRWTSAGWFPDSRTPITQWPLLSLMHLARAQATRTLSSNCASLRADINGNCQSRSTTRKARATSALSRTQLSFSKAPTRPEKSRISCTVAQPSETSASRTRPKATSRLSQSSAGVGAKGDGRNPKARSAMTWNAPAPERANKDTTSTAKHNGLQAPCNSASLASTAPGGTFATVRCVWNARSVTHVGNESTRRACNCSTSWLSTRK